MTGTESMRRADVARLEVRGVRKTFEAENAPVRALRGVDLTVNRGAFMALMGPSGCGKSTLLNLVAGLEEADEGSIDVAGESMTGGGEDERALIRRRHIGIVFQFFNLLEGMSVLENVRAARDHRRQAAGKRRRGQGPRPARPAGHRRQARATCPACSRAASASASPSRAPWPTSRRCCWPTSRPARSTRSAAARWSSCSAACTTRARPIIMVTHDASVASAADEVLHMRDGRLAEAPAPETVLA